MTHACRDRQLPLTMTTLEEQLLADDGQAQRDRLGRQLLDIEFRLRRDMAAGMPRPDFPAWQSALGAVAAARAVIDHLPPAPAGHPPSIVEGLFRSA
jgi:hypothetical protein